MPDDIKLKKYEEVLMTALAFSEEDLATNEVGALSPHQVLDFQQRRNVQAVIAGLYAIVFAFIGLMMVTAPRSVGPMLFLALLFSLLVFWIGRVAPWQLNSDLQAGVQSAEGRIELEVRSAENGTAYFVKLDDRKFKVKKPAFLAFKNGDPYRIYYAPHSQTILSVDWLRDDDPFIDADERRAPPMDAHTESAIASESSSGPEGKRQAGRR